MSNSAEIVAKIEAQNAHEIELLKGALKRIGKADESGNYVTTFGAVFKDDVVANTFESLASTLKSAKQKKIINYESPLLLQGAHDNVVITLYAAYVPE